MHVFPHGRALHHHERHAPERGPPSSTYPRCPSITGDFLAEAGGEFLARIEPAPEEPETSALSVSVFPNPVRDRATFRFSIPEASRVTLKIYDMLGREVMTLFDADHEAGSATLLWNPADHSGRPMPNGVYVYRLTLADLIYTGAVTVLN